MIRPLSLALWAIALGFTGSAAMATNTISFEGEVRAQTCQARVAGQENAVVLLPTVSLNELKDGQSAGATPFRVDVSDCGVSGAEQRLMLLFSGRELSAGGHLANMAGENAAENVVIRLTQDGHDLSDVFCVKGSSPCLSKVARSNNAIVLQAGSDAGSSEEYTAAYHVEGGQAKPGKVKAVLEYTVVYH